MIIGNRQKSKETKLESSRLKCLIKSLVCIDSGIDNEQIKRLRTLSIAAIIALGVVAIGWVGVTGTAIAQEEPESVYNVTEIETADSVTIGEELEIETTITNNGDGAGDQSVAAHFSGPGEDDFVADSVDNVTLEPGESETFTFSLDTSDFEETGDGLAAIHTDDEAVGVEVMIQEEGENVFEVSSLDPESATVSQGDEIDVSALITNAGDVEAEQDIQLQVDGTVVATQNLTLDVGEDQTVTFENVSTVDLTPGEYEHSLVSEDDTETGTLTVEPGVATYTNDNDIVEAGGVFDAIADWRAGDVSPDLVFDVIDAWRSGEPVE